MSASAFRLRGCNSAAFFRQRLRASRSRSEGESPSSQQQPAAEARGSTDSPSCVFHCSHSLSSGETQAGKSLPWKAARPPRRQLQQTVESFISAVSQTNAFSFTFSGGFRIPEQFLHCSKCSVPPGCRWRATIESQGVVTALPASPQQLCIKLKESLEGEVDSRRGLENPSAPQTVSPLSLQRRRRLRGSAKERPHCSCSCMHGSKQSQWLST